MTYTPKYHFSSLPSHDKVTMPALSPTMTEGNIAQWNFKIGDKIEVGDALCDIETDKATLSFEMQEEGYLAAILVEGGSKNIQVGTPIAIVVDDEGSVKAFKDYKGDSSSDTSSSSSSGASSSKKEETKQESTQ